MALAALALFAAVLSMEYGRRGFMPLDHSITFDGGWRVLSGQLPYREFTTPSGLVPILIQAALFGAFGVTWFAYCLHAALFNAAFAILTYGTLREAGEGRLLSLLFGGLAAVVFYPGVGVPSHDHHSFAFGLLATYLLLVASRRSGARTRLLLWAASGAALALGLLSKQIPAGFLVPVLAVTGLMIARDERARFLFAFAAGGAAIAVLAVVAGLAAGVDWSAVRLALLDLPRAQGTERFGRIRWSQDLLQATGSSPTFALPPLGFVIAGAVVVRSIVVRSAGSFVTRLRAEMPILFLAAGLAAASAAFNAVTNNHPGYGSAYLPVSLGLTQLGWRCALRADGSGGRPASKRGRDRRRRVAVGVVTVAVLVGLVETYRYHAKWTVSRELNDFLEPPVTEDGAVIAPPMAFMEFAMPEATSDPAYGRYRAEDLRDVVDFFEKHPGNFFLLGDTSILYALTGRPSVNPALWFHPGLTIPEPGTEAWTRYEDRILESMRDNDCRYVVVEHKGTWMGVYIGQFPELTRLLAEPAGPPRRFGPFYVVPIDVDRSD